MLEASIVRENLITKKGYKPYCGDDICKPNSVDRWPRTKWNGEQFCCPKCGWESQFPIEFIERYKEIIK